jgi:hypothetical protein
MKLVFFKFFVVDFLFFSYRICVLILYFKYGILQYLHLDFVVLVEELDEHILGHLPHLGVRLCDGTFATCAMQQDVHIAEE